MDTVHASLTQKRSQAPGFIRRMKFESCSAHTDTPISRGILVKKKHNKLEVGYIDTPVKAHLNKRSQAPTKSMWGFNLSPVPLTFDPHLPGIFGL